MNKSDLADALAEAMGHSKADSTRVVDALFNPDDGIIAEELGRGGKVQIMGFGAFEIRERKSREGRNPQTGESIKVPASRAPAFKAGKGLKEAL